MDDPCDRFYFAKGEGIKELHRASISEDAEGLKQMGILAKTAVGMEVAENGWVQNDMQGIWTLFCKQE